MGVFRCDLGDIQQELGVLKFSELLCDGIHNTILGQNGLDVSSCLEKVCIHERESTLVFLDSG